LSRQQAPVCPTPADPFHGFDQTAAGGFISAYVGVRRLVQERPDLAPLVVTQSHSCQVHMLRGSGQTSTEPGVYLYLADILCRRYGPADPTRRLHATFVWGLGFVDAARPPAKQHRGAAEIGLCR